MRDTERRQLARHVGPLRVRRLGKPLTQATPPGVDMELAAGLRVDQPNVADVGKLLLSSVTIFFSSKHLTPRAAQLQETLVALQDVLMIRRDRCFVFGV